jgi:hypothetical protein
MRAGRGQVWYSLGRTLAQPGPLAHVTYQGVATQNSLPSGSFITTPMT